MKLLTMLLINKMKNKGGMTPTGTINITENGTVDVTNYASADVNVSGRVVLPAGIKFQYSTCSEMNWLANADTSNLTYVGDMFYSCSNLVSLPQFDTSTFTYIVSLFNQCTKLTTLPVLDFRNVTYMYNIFTGCTALSDESLNNILASLLTVTESFVDTKKLKSLGLTSSQASKCTTLSNWPACQSAGWITGY